MDKFEKRRQALQTLVNSMGRGAIASVAKQIGIEPSYVSRLLYPEEKKGGKRMGEDTATALAKAFPSFFIGENALFDDAGLSATVPVAPPLFSDIAPAYHSPDAVMVPVLANCGSMGPGESLLESDVIVGDLALSPHWINQYIRPQNPRELRFIHAYGDSMAPTFTDGDVLLVDTGIGARDPSLREGVYVLQAGDKNYVKRVTPTFDGKLQVTSDNPSSKTVQVLNGDHQVQVLGRVVWAWNGKRL